MSKEKLLFVCPGSRDGKGCTDSPRIGLQGNTAARGNVPITDSVLNFSGLLILGTGVISLLWPFLCGQYR